MRNLLLSLSFSLLLLSLSCCKKELEPATLSLDQTEISFDSLGGSADLKLSANGEWKADDLPNWITLSHQAGDASEKLVITAEKNHHKKPREVKIAFVREDQTVVLGVVQAAKERGSYHSNLDYSLFSDLLLLSINGKTEQTYNFSVYSRFINPSRDLNPESPLYLGNLVDRKLKANEEIAAYERYTFNPITVSASTPGTYPKTFTPSKSAQEAYAKEIIDKKPKQSEEFISDGVGIQFDSYRQLHLLGVGNMGVKLDELISGKSYKAQEMTKNDGIIYSFSHTLFTIIMDYGVDLLTKELKKEDFPDSNPSYINTVSYGRMGLLIVETDHLVEKVKVVVNKALRSKSDSFSQEEMEILNELDAYHIYYNPSRELEVTKGKLNTIRSYGNQVSEDLDNIHPLKYTMWDYFTHESVRITYSVPLP